MKLKILTAMIISAALWLDAPPAPAQSAFTNLHNFSVVAPNATNADGANPYFGLSASGGALYGTTENGGKSSGNIFRLNPDGSGFTNLYSFSGMIYNPRLQNNTNPDGANPAGELVFSGANCYGVTQNGGTNGTGVIFKIGTNGMNYTVLHTFSAPVPDTDPIYADDPPYTNADGATPYAGLALSGGTLYGTTAGGGSGAAGIIFSLNAGSLQFTNLYNFTPTVGNPATGIYTNRDGSFSRGTLAVLNGVLYGTTYDGGTGGAGTVFRINANGQSFTNLHNFGPPGYNYSLSIYTNRDGINPEAGVVTDGAALYGTAYMGAPAGYGTVFRLNLSGGGFTNLYNLTYGDDGANLRSGMVLSNNVLYGTAENGGATGYGTVFQLGTNGAAFSTVYAFSQVNTNAAEVETNRDGESPDAGLLLAGNALYGTASAGGANGNGTVFALMPPAEGTLRLNFQSSGKSLVLSWTNLAWSLQSASNVSGPYADVSGATSPRTNAETGSLKFFRLRSP